MAGEGDTIARFVRELEIQLPDLRKLERPMRRIGDMANACRVETIAIEPFRSTGSQKIIGVHNVMARQDRRLRNLGLVGAIGSARQDLLNFSDQIDGVFEGKSGREGRPLNAYEKGAFFARHLNNSRLADETFGLSKGGWGGYIEHAWLNFESGEWIRGPDELHLFFTITPSEKDRVGLGMIPKCVAYHPGSDTRPGRLLGINLSAGLSQEFILDGISNSPGVDRDDGFDWKDWRPKRCTSSVTTFYKGGALKHNCSTTGDQEKDFIVFDVSEKSIRFGLDLKYADHVLGGGLRGMGFNYKPFDAVGAS